MVKRGGTKKKISIKKISKKEALAVTYSKRTNGLYSKASQLCLLSDAQMAILATPPSSESNASFYSFGHSSVETLVEAYLNGKRHVSLSEESKDTREDVGVCMTRMDLGLGFWWDDEKLNSSENLGELKEAVESIAALLKSVKKLNQRDHCNQQDNEELVVHATQEHDQALDFKKVTEFLMLDDSDYLHENLNNDQAFFNGEDPKKNNVVSHKGSQEQDQALNFGSNSDMVVLSDALPSNSSNFTEEQAQIFSVCQSFCDTDNNMSALGRECSNEEMDIEKLIDYEMTPDEIMALESSLEGFETTEEEFVGGGSGSLLMNNEDRGFVFQNCATNLVQGDNAAFSNLFNEFTSLIH